MTDSSRDKKNSELNVPFYYVGVINCDNPSTARMMEHLPQNLFRWGNSRNQKKSSYHIIAERLDQYVHIYPARPSFDPSQGRLEIIAEKGVDILNKTKEKTTFRFHDFDYILYHRQTTVIVPLKNLVGIPFPDYLPIEGL